MRARRLVEIDIAVYSKNRSEYTQRVFKVSRHAKNAKKFMMNNNRQNVFKYIVNGTPTQLEITTESVLEKIKTCIKSLDVLLEDDDIGVVLSGPANFKKCSKCGSTKTPRNAQVNSADEGMRIVGWDCSNAKCF
jgi:hypothetical protein